MMFLKNEDKGQEVVDKMKEMEDKVQCGYFRVGFLFGCQFLEKVPFPFEEFTAECMHPECFKMECDILEGRSCTYHSLEAEDALDKQPDWEPF